MAYRAYKAYMARLRGLCGACKWCASAWELPLTPLGHTEGRRGLCAVLVLEPNSAERVLLGDTLEQKLRPCGLVEGGASRDVAWPGRERLIAMGRAPLQGREALPKMKRLLESEAARVQCLRKFANHAVWRRDEQK